jgi:uncharacterized protein (DUF952 family)
MTPRANEPHPAPGDCIYHLVTNSEWEKARASGVYAPASLASEGFLHCSMLGQLAPVAERYFPGRDGVVILRIDRSRLTSPVRYEESEPGEHYPHLYGPLDLRAVVESRPLRFDSLGRAQLPSAWHEEAGDPV